ncbi:MAG: hypothetical protein HYU48_01965 [Candidatus Levybacteria bacterium]|nr:hypothetical protein [Candidatus Levybacteria bacterium]
MAAKTKHTGHYFSLILILGLGLLGLKVAYPNRILETEIAILTAIFYVIWGIVHHHQNHSLNSKIVIEYILIAALGMAVLLFFIAGTFGI